MWGFSCYNRQVLETNDATLFSELILQASIQTNVFNTFQSREIPNNELTRYIKGDGSQRQQVFR